ncbi:hydantoinase B/oxoprolinase family protein [Kordiimonas sp.]|uniref:hydantoinase B/oxoprolinase family protein n=1 Tax=Kordiimonas sp. TaxID=1970157 RepID=UPI003A8D5A12
MTQQQTATLSNPIEMEVFTNRLLAVADEIGTSMIRASFSSNIKERKDCSVALFSGDGRLIAQASHIPLHLGSLSGSVRAVLDAYPTETIQDGDVFICNDPYAAGGTHTPDISVVTPVFADGKLRYFTANVGHHSDVGGTVPGSIHGAATSIFEEGLRLPVMKLFREGDLDEDLLRMIALNSRSADERWLDIKVQAAANERGVRLMRELAQTQGADRVDALIEDLFSYTSQRLRNRIAEMKDGTASFSASIESDGIGEAEVPIQANVTVKGERLIVDFEGTGPQARGALNVVASALNASVYYVVKTLLDPYLLPNSGMFDGIEISAPKGSLLNPNPPAATGARSITCNRVVRALIGAFSQLLPEDRAQAAGQDIVPVMVFSGTLRGRNEGYVYVESMGGGAGARASGNGMDGIHVHVTNSSNLPIEPLEIEYDLVVDEYALVDDSAGGGRYRGGMGIARQISAPNGGVRFTARSDGHRSGAPGANGGTAGREAHLIKNAGSNHPEELSPMVANLVLEAGESIRLETPGGGGYGDPSKRDVPALGRDLRDGRISQRRAEAIYGADKVEEALQSL